MRDLDRAVARSEVFETQARKAEALACDRLLERLIVFHGRNGGQRFEMRGIAGGNNGLPMHAAITSFERFSATGCALG
ncbi:hypothetical protein C8N35_11639 [Breoghania corrubedonensis]|uniref:Uncharacterized protein n=1 Tax=Breoghania corrubedonensis TaxID=665038 RepID=A0A2T5UPZ1_9HYPH|nr:hypothetical protein [Breoghania corrubedonensis]PTW53584.1 hypothetical protein C8N35_11639 [Breoghania corrubedonensis]